jgi:RecB family exonuclease
MNKQAWSYSRLKSFEECPLQCYWKNYAPKGERLKFEQNQYTRRGSQLHKQLEIAVQKFVPSRELRWDGLDPAVVSTLSLLHPLINKADAIHPELQLAFSSAWTPSDWYATNGDTWLRVIMDLVLIYGDKAFIPDYKTGKVREDNVDQLEVTALAAFKYFPRLNHITTAFLWMDHKKKTIRKYTRDMVESLDHKYRERAGLIDIVAKSGDWQAKPNFGCRWCQVDKTKCGYAGG